VAPEVLKGSYTEKCDVWSLGVIMFLLLSGKPPFNGPNDQAIFEKIYKGSYSMEGEEWESISDEAKDLIKKMLTMDYKLRPSAKECLTHPWFKTMIEQKEINTKIPIARRSLRNLKDFRAKNQLQEAILYFLVNQLTSVDEKNELMAQFTMIDKDGDGLLTRDELITAYKNTGMDPEEAKNIAETILSNVDKSSSGAINYSEFITATVSKRKLFSSERLEGAFKLFDVNGTGEISVEELKEIFGGGAFLEIDDGIWNEMIQKFSENGKIKFETFVEMMKQFIENEYITQNIRND